MNLKQFNTIILYTIVIEMFILCVVIIATTPRTGTVETMCGTCGFMEWLTSQLSKLA